MRTATNSITNSDDIIDSRDVIARIEHLRDEIESAGEDPDEDEKAELATLEALQDEAKNSASEWEDGACLIADSYFETYAQELAEDIGSIPKDAAWPACHIDWEAAADALKQDYSSVDFDGAEYWVRA